MDSRLCRLIGSSPERVSLRLAVVLVVFGLSARGPVMAAGDDATAKRNAAFAAGIDEVRQSGLLESAIGVGDQAADFELPVAGGGQVRLSELLSAGPVVLVYYRGGWCPFCNKHLAELQKSLEEIESLGGQLIAVSPELPEQGQATLEKGKFTFPILSDRGNKVARRYGLAYRLSEKVIPYYDQFFDIEEFNGDRSYELPLSATYVFDTEGVVRYAFLDADYKRRSDPREIVSVLRKLKRGSLAPAAKPAGD